MSAAPRTTAALLALDIDEREVLLAELAALLAVVHDRDARHRYLALESAVASGTVEGELVPQLEGVVELSLDTGRARRMHAAEGERTLLRLFSRTPRGTTARQVTESINRALSELSGQTIEGLLFTVQAPGVYRLGIQTDRCRLALNIDRHGLSAESVEV
jgi:putative component of toxin-antitoxin plasmid stabilization module